MFKILFVDDNENIRRGIEDYLQSEGYEVVIAGGVVEARKFFDESIDLLITDYNMPDGTGFELASDLALKFKTGFKKILISGILFDVPGFERAFFDATIAKPFGVGELQAAIEKLLPQ